VSSTTIDAELETKRKTESAVTERSSETIKVVRFLRNNWTILLLVSAIVLIPCLWHRHIEAGDLGSHEYVSWLANLIEQGRVPGLFIAPQWNNIVVDFGLSWLGPRIGFAAAEKIIVSACALTFFWGAFAFIAASTRRIPWAVTPAIVIVTYGFTFYAGFMNFYLSLGLAFFAIAITWRGQRSDWIIGALLAGLSLLAHPMGFGLLIALAIYIHVAESVRSPYRLLVLAAAILFIVCVHFALPHFFRTEALRGTKPLAMNGADQLILFRHAYIYIALLAFVFGSCAFLAAAFVDYHREDLAQRIRTPMELWLILLIAATMVPAAIWFPAYSNAVSAINSRITTVTATLGLCILGAVAPRKWIFGGLSVIALIFFALQYRDTAVFNKMEQETAALVAGIPYGSKVSYTIDQGSFSRINTLHFVDRACIGHCFAFSNYEPGSKQFRVRLAPGGSSIVSSDGLDLEHGNYVVREQDLPLYQIYQPDDHDLTKLAIRPLAAGEKNGRIGHHIPQD
jgi:MFS family permease